MHPGIDAHQRRARRAAGLDTDPVAFVSKRELDRPIVTFTCDRCGMTNAKAVKPNAPTRNRCEFCGHG